MMTVITIEATVVPIPPLAKTESAMTVAMEEDAILTRLFPISIAGNISSYFSQSFKASFDDFDPSSAKALSLLLFTPAKAISLPEKNAEKIIRITIMI